MNPNRFQSSILRKRLLMLEENEVALQSMADFIISNPANYDSAHNSFDADPSTHRCQAQRPVLKKRRGFNSAIIARRCNPLCLLTESAHSQLLDIERSLKEVTACQAKCRRDIETLEVRWRAVSASINPVTYSRHAQRLVPAAVLSNSRYRGEVSVGAVDAAAVANFIARRR